MDYTYNPPTTTPNDDSTSIRFQQNELYTATLLDASNGFNELSRFHMLWTIRHLWPRASRFAFNCYRFYSILIVRNLNQPITILHSKEGVQQGDPLSMLLYGITLTPLIKHLKNETNNQDIILNILHSWYADDATLVTTPEITSKIITILTKSGPSYGYFVQPEKSFHICTAEQEQHSRLIFSNNNLKLNYVRGHRYLGGFLGDESEKIKWLQPKIDSWKTAIKTLSKVARTYPQSAYASFTNCLQPQWYYLCRLTPNVSQLLMPLEDEIKNNFLPSLFSLPNIDQNLRTLTSLPVKFGGLNIQNPTDIAETAYNTSVTSTKYLVSSLLNNTNFDFSTHSILIKNTKNQTKKIKTQNMNPF